MPNDPLQSPTPKPDDPERLERKRAGARVRKARYRTRQPEGLACALVEINRATAEDLLVEIGLLPLHSADNQEAFAAALSTFVNRCIEDGIEAAAALGTRSVAKRRNVAV